MGTGINRKCEQDAGSAIAGCIQYKTHTNGVNYCSACDTSITNNVFYYDSQTNDPTKNKCVICDLASNYLKQGTGDCTSIVSPVAGCEKYIGVGNDGQQCGKCVAGKALIIGNPPACVNEISNCKAYGPNGDQCFECNTGYFVNAGNTCSAGTVANCKSMKNGDGTKCTTCNDGYYATFSQTCSLNIPNCKVATPGAESARCSQCMDGYTMVGITETSCEAINVADCLNSNTSRNKDACDLCKDKFALKADKSACSAFPTDCSKAGFDGNVVKCAICDNSAKYYATDIKGTSKFSLSSVQYWEQVCTKSTGTGTTNTSTGTATAGTTPGTTTTPGTANIPKASGAYLMLKDISRKVIALFIFYVIYF